LAKNEAYLKEVAKYTEQMKKLSKQEVVVGIPADKNKQHYGSAETNAGIGAIHEYGAPVVGIPQRSFLRLPLTLKAKEIFALLKKDLKFSKIDTKKALGRLGAKGQSVVLEAFDTQGNGKWAELKPSTVRGRKKGSGEGTDKPLRDTGQLKQSITFEVRDA